LISLVGAPLFPIRGGKRDFGEIRRFTLVERELARLDALPAELNLSLRVESGERVVQGQVVATVESPDLARKHRAPGHRESRWRRAPGPWAR